jgi:hypothetical protein
MATKEITNAAIVSKATMVSESTVAIKLSEVTVATMLSKHDPVHIVATVCSNNDLGPCGLPRS